MDRKAALKEIVMNGNAAVTEIVGSVEIIGDPHTPLSAENHIEGCIGLPNIECIIRATHDEHVEFFFNDFKKMRGNPEQAATLVAELVGDIKGKDDPFFVHTRLDGGKVQFHYDPSFAEEVEITLFRDDAPYDLFWLSYEECAAFIRMLDHASWHVFHSLFRKG